MLPGLLCPELYTMAPFLITLCHFERAMMIVFWATNRADCQSHLVEPPSPEFSEEPIPHLAGGERSHPRHILPVRYSRVPPPQYTLPSAQLQ